VEHAFDAIILGAGAAGLMCAIEAGKHGRKVVVLERSDGVGKKILISGGGRCNFTNRSTAAENFLSANPHFAKSALARYTPEDFIRLVDKHGIPYHEKKLGQLFCDHSARDITTMLGNECRAAKVDIRINIEVSAVDATDCFTVRTGSDTFRAPRLVVATGGLSIPKIGATSFGYDLARQFGLKIQAPRPALVPFVFSEADRKRWCDLAGVSAEVVAATRNRKFSFQENMLFTRRGISGPAILQISSYWNVGEPIVLNLTPHRKLVAELKLPAHRDAASWKALLRDVLPRRFADRWLEVYPLAGSSDRALAESERRLHTWEVIPASTEGYGKAEVTAGGIDTDELSPQTMQSRKIPGLFFIGEVVDVTGQLGGFNFQWAWASGFCAGRAL